MSLAVTCRIDGDALGDLQRMAERVADLRPLLHRIGALIREDLLRQFQAAGEPRWRPLSPSTIAQKRRQGYPRLSRDGKPPTRMIQNGQFGPQNILMRTGALLSSYVDDSDPDHIEQVTESGIEVGSSLPYADHHQYGTRRMAARPLTITAQGLAAIERAAETYMEEDHASRPAG